jgi:transposase
VSRSQLGRRLANIPRCLIGMEACSGSHHIGRQLAAVGHDVRLIPAQYVKPFLKGHKNDYRDAEAIAEAVQRPTMHFVAIKTPEQMDLLALHRVRSRLVGQRTGVINQIRGFLIERGITVRQGAVPLRKALPDILSSNTDVLSPRMVRLIADLAQDWRRLDERIATVSAEIEALAQQDDGCQRLMTVPGVGTIISSATVAAIGNGAGFKQGRDFGAWLGLVPKQVSTGDARSWARSPSAATST